MHKLKEIIETITVGDGEIAGKSRQPFISSDNVLNGNERGIQLPNDMISVVEACCYCRKISQQLKSCSKCKKAKYCSKDCQTNHWIKHKHLCKLLHESYVIEVQMCDTESNNLRHVRGPSELLQATVNMKSFSPKLVGIQQGTPLDRNSSKRFIVRIQSGREYPYYDPHSQLMVYNQTVTFDITLSNPKLYHLCNECGVLTDEKLTIKKIFCWASFNMDSL
ncbi:unnamed protein product [Mytilus coruscus]|uniref:MYND-type domain-containing protein n=1 Tax=Mytilus coruscus TaxID=42192 RepID=A0A6J8E7Y9_MYTCO|nr:unnamed protein product [Mytilus coruscus]